MNLCSSALLPHLPWLPGLPVAFGTAFLALMDRAHLQPGQTLLVMGAAGGVGLAAVQLGKESAGGWMSDDE